MTSILCRDCGWLSNLPAAPQRCGQCGSPRIIVHPELAELAIAHLDCDAFYATVEKRDRPELADLPVIVGGGARGVVLACCYVARLYGVRSAMPMFKALAACPNAVVIRPDMAKYRDVGRAVRAEMRSLTPLVEPLSIDEAFLDLSGTAALHGAAPAQLLAALVRRVEATLGVTVSVGLSYNKFLAKLASDLDKPRGFAVIGRAEAAQFLADKPAGWLWGVGGAMQRRLAADGIINIGQLRGVDARELARRYGKMGARLAQLARGEDGRKVEPDGRARSISAETTFTRDEADAETLARELWPLCEKVSARLKQNSLAARGHAEAENRRFSAANPLAPLRRSDPTRRRAVSHRANPAAQRSRWRYAVPPDWCRGRKHRRQRRSKSADPVRNGRRQAAAPRRRDRRGSPPARRRRAAARRYRQQLLTTSVSSAVSAPPRYRRVWR